MDHLIIAQFPSHEPARRCLEALRRDPRYGHIEVVVRVPNKPHQTVPVSVSHAKVALIKGVLIGGLTGIVTGALVGWAGYRFEALDPAIVFAFAALGLVLGSLGAALIGPINPNPEVLKLEEQPGVTIVVNAPRLDDRRWVEQILCDHSGKLETVPRVPVPRPAPHPA